MSKSATEFNRDGYRYQVRRKASVSDRDIWYECVVISRPERDGKPYGLGLRTIVLFTRSDILKLARS